MIKLVYRISSQDINLDIADNIKDQELESVTDLLVDLFKNFREASAATSLNGQYNAFRKLPVGPYLHISDMLLGLINYIAKEQSHYSGFNELTANGTAITTENVDQFLVADAELGIRKLQPIELNSTVLKYFYLFHLLQELFAELKVRKYTIQYENLYYSSYNQAPIIVDQVELHVPAGYGMKLENGNPLPKIQDGMRSPFDKSFPYLHISSAVIFGGKNFYSIMSYPADLFQNLPLAELKHSLKKYTGIITINTWTVAISEFVSTPSQQLVDQLKLPELFPF